MPSTPTASVSDPAMLREPLFRALALVVLVLAGLASYANSFRVPFLFDDDLSIKDNPTIRTLWPPLAALTPPNTGAPVTGRPVVNYTLAINYALGGLAPRGYHALNLGVHLGAALLLFGIVRRTLRQPAWRVPDGAGADSIAFVTALWWMLHPLQTESVTLVVQRTESLMGLLFLLTLYASIRSLNSDRWQVWQGMAFGACLLGMATKEVMSVAPVIVLLYDRALVSGSFRAAWERRGRFYAALVSTWVLLAWLVVGLSHGSRGGTCGFGTAIAPWAYLCTQAEGIVRYLRLVFWPDALVADYGTYVARDPRVYIPCLLFLSALLVASVVALRRRPELSLAGLWFFLILAPSSSIVPIATQTLAEHRMYLPLAAPLLLAAVGLRLVSGRGFLAAGLAVAVVLGVMTAQRNLDYRDAVTFWADVAAKRPENARAHYSLGTALLQAARPAEAIPPLTRAVELDPAIIGGFTNLGTALSRVGRLPEAFRAYEQALQRNPADPEANNNLGALWYSTGRLDRAIFHYRQVLQVQPEHIAARYNLALALANTGRLDEAIGTFREVLEREPGLVAGWCNLAWTLRRAGRPAEAAQCYREALRREPASAEARAGLEQLTGGGT